MEGRKTRRVEGWKRGKLLFFQSSTPPVFQSSNLPILQSSIIAVVLFTAAFSLYLTTLAPSVVTLFDDSLEFQLVTYQLGIAHPTGYPLYTLLGKLFTFLPVGNVAYRVNLMSAFFGAATVSCLYLLIVQIFGTMEEARRRGGQEGNNSSPPTLQPSRLPILHLSALISAATFAVSPVFWQQATIAEVYTLNAFLVALLLWAAALPLRLEAVAFLAGLALAHHRTSLLLLPALALYLYLNQKPGFLKNPGFYKTMLLSLLAGLAPLLLYLYLPLRGQVGSLDGTYQNTWAGFWRQVSAGGYGAFIFGNPFQQARDFAFYTDLFQNQFYTLIPGLIGLGYLAWRGPRRMLLLTGGAFLTYTLFNLFYNVSDIEVFFIPPFLIWAVWNGLGAMFLLKMTADRRPQTAVQRLTWIAPVIILLAFLFIIFRVSQTALPLLAARNTWQVHDYGLDMLQQPLPKGNSVVVGIVGEMTLLRYFQQTEKLRPDAETVAADKEADRLAVVEQELAAGKAVYLTRPLPGAPARWSLSAVGPLIRVYPEPVTAPPNLATAVNQAVTPAITLLGYDLSRPPHTGGGPAPVRLTLYWQAAAPISAGLKVSARLRDGAGTVVSVTDAAPVHFAYPTTAWRPGEVISDVYDLAWPPETAPGPYRPLLIWYDPAQNAAEVGRIELPPLAVE